MRLIFGSGMAAISTALFAFLKQGDHIVIAASYYGGTYNLLFPNLKNLALNILLQNQIK